MGLVKAAFFGLTEAFSLGLAFYFHFHRIWFNFSVSVRHAVVHFGHPSSIGEPMRLPSFLATAYMNLKSADSAESSL